MGFVLLLLLSVFLLLRIWCLLLELGRRLFRCVLILRLFREGILLGTFVALMLVQRGACLRFIMESE